MPRDVAMDCEKASKRAGRGRRMQGWESRVVQPSNQVGGQGAALSRRLYMTTAEEVNSAVAAAVDRPHRTAVLLVAGTTTRSYGQAQTCSSRNEPITLCYTTRHHVAQ